MKLLAAALLAACSLSCAAKKPVKSHLAIPPRCITGGVLEKTACTPYKGDEYLCNFVRVRAACVEVEK